MDPKIAECVGLWLAEGDNKTKSEITFTNNCFDLVEMFYKRVICNYAGNPRVYVYSAKKSTGMTLGHCAIRYYQDSRARKPYYLLRLASVSAVKDWKRIVAEYLEIQSLYPSILSGFFAGEGNIKTGSHNQRVLRIAQKQPKKFIDTILNDLGLTFRFKKHGRAYEISGKWNWDIFARHRLADLHPIKREKFWVAFKEFKENHYPAFYLKEKVFEELNRPKTTKELATNMNRSYARICDVLIDLKKEGRIKNVKVGFRSYWSNQDDIIISKVKEKYRELLNNGLTRPHEFASELAVTWMTARKQLGGLKSLGLANDYKGRWHAVPTQTRIVVI